MGFAVIHLEKGTAGKAGGLGNHIDRTKYVPNANPELSEWNHRIDLENHTPKWTTEKNNKSLQTRIDERIKAGYTGKTAIRKDAVTHLNVVMTGSHEDMLRLLQDEKLGEWGKDNFKFACNRFGSDNIVEFTIHLDERTPHIHCVVVPLTADGRLSAKEVMGNREKMTDLQEQYGQAMEKYNLQRGVKGSQATHDSIQEYYGRINERLSAEPYRTVTADQMPPQIGKPPLIGREKWQENQNKAILEHFYGFEKEILHRVNEQAENSLKIAQNEKLQSEEQASRLRKENAQLRGMVKEQDKALHPERYQRKPTPLQDKRPNKIQEKKDNTGQYKGPDPKPSGSYTPQDSVLKEAIENSDFTKMVEMKNSGYKPSKEFMNELIQDKSIHDNTKIAINKIFDLNMIKHSIADIKLARSEPEEQNLKRKKGRGFGRGV